MPEQFSGNTLYLWIGILNIVNMSALPKLSYKLNETTIKILIEFLKYNNKMNLKFYIGR